MQNLKRSNQTSDNNITFNKNQTGNLTRLIYFSDMPIYEFKCRSCSCISSILVKGFALPEGLKCEKCGSTDIAKIVSRVNYHGSSNERLSSYDPKARKTDGFYRDSRNIGLEAERMLKRAGVEPGDDFKAKLEKVRTDPSSVLKDS